MAPKKKKQPRNAFFFFMRDFREDQEQKGVRFPNGMKDVAEAANPAWKALSTEDKLYYEDLANESKLKDKTNLENKYTTTGISYAQLEREDRERRRQELSVQLEIEGTVRSLDKEKDLPYKVFHFIHFNYYCRLENGTYVICEMALSAFNLNDGIIKTYHTIVCQERIPLGYTYESSKTSEDSHRIPLPPINLGESYSGNLFVIIKNFLQGADKKEKLPPLYTLPSSIEVVQTSLTQLTEIYYPEELGVFRVYPLNHLFFELRNKCAPSLECGFPVMHLADRELDKDQYNFAPGISCHLHEKTDACVYCSLSIVQRWVFLICDHCCRDLGIDVKPGKHVPINAAVNSAQDKDKIKEKVNMQAPADPEQPSTSGCQRPAMPPPVRLIDHSKLGPSEDDASYFNVSTSTSSRPNIQSSSAGACALPLSNQKGSLAKPSRSLTSGSCWGARKDNPPPEVLRLPKTAAPSVESSLKFTEDDFPAIGSSNHLRPPGMAPGKGRGRGLVDAGPSVDSRQISDLLDKKMKIADSPMLGGRGRGRGKKDMGYPGDGVYSRTPVLVAGRGWARSRNATLAIPDKRLGHNWKPGSRSGSESSSASEIQ